MNDQPGVTGPNKFFDITPPGQTIPPTTSRPVIVSNKPEQTDQSVQLRTPQPGPVNQIAINTPAASNNVAQPIKIFVPEQTEKPQSNSNYEVANPQAILSLANSGSISYPSEQNSGDNQLPSGESFVRSEDVSSNNSTADINQVVVRHDRGLIKSLFWLALLVFAVLLIFDAILDWGNLNFLPHTHFMLK